MKTLLFGAALAATVLTGAASASTVNVQYQPSGLFGPNNLYKTVRINTAGPGYDGRVKAGLFFLNGDKGMGDFLALCIDLVQYMNNPTEYTITPSLIAGAVRDNVDKLFTTALGGGTLGGVINTKVKAAGFQIALWEILNDTGAAFDLTSGNFSMSQNAAVQAKAEQYLSAITPGAAMGGYDMTFLASTDYQDVMTVTPVPLPATGILLAFGIGGLFAARRRRKAG